MNDKSFELNIVILFILLFVLTLIVFNMGSLAGSSIILCIVWFYILHFCNFIDYNVITTLKSRNEIELHPLFTDSYISNKFG